MGDLPWASESAGSTRWSSSPLSPIAERGDRTDEVLELFHRLLAVDNFAVRPDTWAYAPAADDVQPGSHSGSQFRSVQTVAGVARTSLTSTGATPDIH